MQQTLSDIEYRNRRKTTRRDEFLTRVSSILPWTRWVEMVRPFYPEGKRGRKPYAIETMLRMYLLQYFFGLSAEGIEDVIYDSYSMRTFMNLDFLTEQVPDATTLLRFHRILEKNNLDALIMVELNDQLKAAGLSARSLY